MADLYEEAQKFRDQLLAGDRRTAAVMVRSYSTAYQAIDREIDRIRLRIYDLREKGVEKERFASLLYQEKRVQALQDKTLAEISRFAQRSDIIVGGAVGEAVIAGSTDAKRLMQTTLPEGISVAPATIDGEPVSAFSPEEVGLRTGALEQLTGVIQPGQPVASIFQSLGPEASKSVTDALISGLALGKNPNEIAAMMRQALGGNLTRALTIARTETLRAYREASRAEYLANDDVVDGWIWVSAASGRTCASCWAQHGSEHPLDEVMATHPRCRCSMAPKTKTWQELGFGRTPESVKIPSGSSLFAKLSAEDQRSILGPGKFAAYRGKKIALTDLVARRQSPVWGPSTREAGLAEALRNAEARKASRPVRQPRPRPVEIETVTQPEAVPRLDLTDPQSLGPLMREVAAEYPDGVFEGQLSLTRKIAQTLRYDALPDVIEDADWDDLLARENLQPMFRGINTGQSRIDDIAIQHGRQFISGDLFVGRGIYGSGTYTADSTWRIQKLVDAGRLTRSEAIALAREEAFDTAYAYAGGDGAMLEMALKPGSRIVDYDARDVQDAFRRWQERTSEAAAAAGDDVRELRFKYELGGDFSQWAMEQGYDAIKIISGSGERESYTVVLNRAAVYVRNRVRSRADFDE